MESLRFFLQVEIESGIGGDREIRPPIQDNSTIVVYLAPQSEPVTLESKVPTPGAYMFAVHYYQPDHPGQIYLSCTPSMTKCYSFICS